jgi:hypothetical protein
VESLKTKFARPCLTIFIYLNFQEEEETEEEESVSRPHNGGHDDDDLDDDEDKLTIDFKGSSDEKSTEFKPSSCAEGKTDQSRNNELIKDNMGTKD